MLQLCPKIAATMTKNSCRELAATLPNISCRIAHDPIFWTYFNIWSGAWQKLFLNRAFTITWVKEKIFALLLTHKNWIFSSFYIEISKIFLLIRCNYQTSLSVIKYYEACNSNVRFQMYCLILEKKQFVGIWQNYVAPSPTPYFVKNHRL